jgi:hypothetical protein
MHHDNTFFKKDHSVKRFWLTIKVLEHPNMWPPMGLSFIPQVTYEHGEPWWNDTDGRKVLIRPPELSGNPTSSHLVVNQKELGKGSGL